MLDLTTEEYEAITTKWEQTNARRVALIIKEEDEGLSPSEAGELERLQRLCEMRVVLGRGIEE